MLRQEELAFIKAISILQLSPALLRQLRMALSRRKNSVVPAGSRSTTSGSGGRAPLCPSSQIASKRKANELAMSEPANRRPETGAGPAHLPATSTVTGELSTVGSRQLVPLEGRVSTRMFWSGPSLRFSQMGRSSPQPWVQTCLNPLSHPRQQTCACLATSPAL